MPSYRDSTITMAGIVIFFIVAISYALFEARGVIFGPTIDVSSGISEVHDQYVVIQGHAKRISSLSMNGKQIPVTENGAFAQPFLLAPGYNRIILDAKDNYGRTEEQVVEFIYTPAATSTSTLPLQQATSSEIASSTGPIAPAQ